MNPTSVPESVDAVTLPSARESNRLRITAALSLGYLAAALACLIQWNSPRPWARVDLFSGGYLFLRFIGSLHSITSSRRVFRSQSLRREWWGQTSNPAIVRWVILLMLADLAVFLDYGHWHLVPGLERHVFQSVGIAVYLLSIASQIWTDSYLAMHFRDKRAERAPTIVGPFRHIRHPRYSAAIFGKVALALVFASVLGWILLLPWTILLLDKVRAEETHLRKIFGANYDAYARRTWRLLPRIY